MKSIFLIILMLGITLPAFPQKNATYTIKQEKVEFTGRIQKKGWTRSTDSYCAQGSDFYLFQLVEMQDGKEIISGKYVIDVVASLEELKNEDYKGKILKCTGQIVEKKWKINPNDGGQHPVSSSPIGGVKGGKKQKDQYYSCNQFRILEIALLDE